MPIYYVNDNPQNNGDHEVHTTDCTYYSKMTNKTSLGLHSNCKEAVKKAKEKYPKSANGCYYCCNECHTS